MSARHPGAPLESSDALAWLKKVALAVNGLLQGKSNNAATVTLAVTPATTTTITNHRITPETVLLLSATTATAAAALATTYFTAGIGFITLTHAASAATDRTFGYALVG